MDVAQGARPAFAGDWRAQLQPEARSRIVNKIVETLKKHLPVSVPEALSEIRKIAVQFEEKIYNTAVNQSDYLRKISLKMLLSMESQVKTNTQENLQNSQAVWDQRPHNPASSGSTIHTRNPGAGDLKAELNQMNKDLKDQYVAGLSALHQISTKLHGDHHVPSQERINLHEDVNFKAMLERSLHSFQINNRNCIQPSLEESIPVYKKQIISILNSEEWIPEQTIHHCIQLSLEESIPMYIKQIISILNSEEWIPEQTIHHSTVQASSTSSTYDKNPALCER